MYKRFNEEDLEFIENWYDPVAFIECVVPENIKAPALWNDDETFKCVKIRPYQYSMLDYSYIYADDDTLSSRENFQRKKGAGDLINIAARNIGKSFILLIDTVLTIIHFEGCESILSSDCKEHLDRVSKPLANFIEEHPFFEIFRKNDKGRGITKSPALQIDTKLGHTCYGKNEKADDPDPGTAYHGPHAHKFLYDEFSYATTKGQEKRISSVSTDGCIERLAGIPDLRVGSPLGKILVDSKKQPWICRIPMYIMQDWDKTEREKQASEYGGIHSLNYRLNVEAELLEGAFGRFQMDRIREHAVNMKRPLKVFEITRDHLPQLDQSILIDRIPAEKIFCASDIGTTGSPSEIFLIFGDQNKYKLVYNIPLFKLTTQEQAKVFKWIYDRLNGCFISIDATSDGGRAIADELAILGIPDEYIIRCMFNSNIIIDFEKDEQGAVKLDEKGNPLERKENQLDWANQLLENLFYNSLLEIPYEEGLLNQLSSYIMTTRNGRNNYGTTCGADHKVQSLQCFALGQWIKEKESMQNINRKKRCIGIV